MMWDNVGSTDKDKDDEDNAYTHTMIRIISLNRMIVMKMVRIMHTES